MWVLILASVLIGARARLVANSIRIDGRSKRTTDAGVYVDTEHPLIAWGVEVVPSNLAVTSTRVVSY